MHFTIHLERITKISPYQIVFTGSIPTYNDNGKNMFIYNGIEVTGRNLLSDSNPEWANALKEKLVPIFGYVEFNQAKVKKAFNNGIRIDLNV